MSTTNKLHTFSEILTDGILVEENEVQVRKTISHVLIPMIQRPYAQGRKSQEGVRKKFLNDIFTVLCDKEARHLELNFLYGTFVTLDGDKNVFELLDGQQRMTTLFLLHWYFANQYRNDENFIFPVYLGKFDYQTRTTSSDFLSKLIHTEVRTDISPSKAIREAAWYSKSFDKDTTIDSMLRMLDSIHAVYKELEIKPTYSDLEKLQFYVLELNGFGLTEELFIRMNARGLQLTPFENFKADLVGYMKKQEEYSKEVDSSLSKMSRKVAYWLNFSSLMDGRWVDLFWTEPEGYDDSVSADCDICFFRFIQRFFANKAILLAEKRKSAKMKEDAFVQFFTNNVEVERHLGFDVYADFLKRGELCGCNLLYQLEHLLNFLTEPGIGRVLLEKLTAPWEKERQWEPWGTEGRRAEDVGQRQMIVFSAMTEFVERVKDINAFPVEAYKIWMRFVHIMVQSTDITDIDAQITLTRLLQEVLDIKIDDEDFEAYKNPRKAIVEYNKTHRDNRYLAAEAEKAEQVMADEAWDAVFAEAEKDEFVQGSCMFYYNKGMSIETYKHRTNQVRLLFDADGVQKSLAEEYLLLRGVLCRNYNWTNIRKNAYNFTITNNGSNRYLRNLTIWNEDASVKRLFCELLDCENAESVICKLNDVVNEEHELIVKDGYWSESDICNLNKVYKRLFKEKEMQPMKWLYELGEKATGCWFYSSGKAVLYKGNVNCMYLSSDRHEYIPSILKDYQDKFGLCFDDKRQYDNYKKYGAFTGTHVNLTSSENSFVDGTRVKLWFMLNDSLTILVSNKECAMQLYNDYAETFGDDTRIDHEGKNIKVDDDNLSVWFENGIEYFRVANIPNLENLTSTQCVQAIAMLYNTITSYQSPSHL